MFDQLTQRLEEAFKNLRGQGRITEKSLDESLREIRRALLEADVNYKVAKAFLQRIREQASGQRVLRSLTPGQQVIKIVRDELIKVLQSNGVSTIEPAIGDEFDPHLHEALMRQPAEGVEPNCITMMMQTGYAHGPRTLRAAKVAVAPAE